MWFARGTLVILSLASLGLLACSDRKEESNPHQVNPLVRVIEAKNITEANAMLAKSSLRCADPAQCPESLALFVAREGDTQLFTCTSFLVAEDLVLTNSHCLPSSVRMLPDLCDENIHFVLPATGPFPEERIACKELVGFSERPNAISPDLALLRLARATKRNFLRIDRAGIPDQALLKTWKIDPVEGAASGLIRKETCRSVFGSYRLPIFHRSNDPIITTGDCSSLPGHSGAPLLNDDGRAVGLLQANLPLSEIMRSTWTPHLLPGESFAPLALGTSLRCLGGLDPFALDPACGPVDAEEIQIPRVSDFLEEPKLREARSQLLQELRHELPDEFLWQEDLRAEKTLTREESFTPTCFAPTENWIERYARPGIDSPEERAQFSRYEENAEIEARIPVTSVTLKFNRYLQPTPRAELLGHELSRYFFSPAEVAETGRGHLRLPSGDEVALEVCAE
jgi:hypothetical protein